jgi:hypothetical protein
MCLSLKTKIQSEVVGLDIVIEVGDVDLESIFYPKSD